MKIVKVMLTCAGSQVGPSLVNMMRNTRLYKIDVIGVDAAQPDRLVGKFFCDRFYKVPQAEEASYIPYLLDICVREKVAVIFPGSDEEALKLSKERDEFSSVNTAMGCAKASSIKKSLDKFELMNLLSKNGVTCAKFYELRELEDIKGACKTLGYPKKDIVIKPRRARGSRGFRIISASSVSFQNFYNNQVHIASLEEIMGIFARYPGKIRDFFIMEYLEGERYSADILMERSRPVSCVCRKKIFPINSPTQIADIVYDKDIIEYAKRVAEFLQFDYFVQIEVGRDRRGRPCLIEINPRIDATLPITEGAGINYFQEMIYSALNGSFRKRYFKQAGRKTSMRFYRYWQHIFRRP